MLAQNHLRVRGEVFVDVVLGAIDSDRHRLTPGLGALKLLARHLLAQEDHIGDNLRAGVLLERGLRQSDGAHQVGALRQVLASLVVQLVHGVAAGDVHHQAARPHSDLS